jgi:hypothetical protein
MRAMDDPGNDDSPHQANGRPQGEPRFEHRVDGQ